MAEEPAFPSVGLLIRFAAGFTRFHRNAHGQIKGRQGQSEDSGSGVVAAGKIGWAIPLGSPCHNLLIALAISTGAGEEIRTLDPNLGKVVLYH